MHHIDDHLNLTYLVVGPSLFSIHPIRIFGSSGTELGNAWIDWQANGQNFSARSAAALTESLRCWANTTNVKVPSFWQHSTQDEQFREEVSSFNERDSHVDG